MVIFDLLLFVGGLYAEGDLSAAPVCRWLAAEGDL